MPRAYSCDLRARLVRAAATGLAPDAIARTTGISRRSLRRWRARQAAGDDLTPRVPTGRPRGLTPDQAAALVAQATVHPDWTRAQHVDAFAASTGTTISPATVSRRFAEAGLTRKKSP
jgi:transposase